MKFISTLLLTGTSNQMAINGMSKPQGTANDRETVNVNVGGGCFQPDTWEELKIPLVAQTTSRQN